MTGYHHGELEIPQDWQPHSWIWLSNLGHNYAEIETSCWKLSKWTGGLSSTPRSNYAETPCVRLSSAFFAATGLTGEVCLVLDIIPSLLHFHVFIAFKLNHMHWGMPPLSHSLRLGCGPLAFIIDWVLLLVSSSSPPRNELKELKDDKAHFTSASLAQVRFVFQ
jgi:hypothetical protein